MGYQCNGTECTPCPAIPAAANWSQWAPREGSRCAYECVPRYFGHPAFEGVCVVCSELQLTVKSAEQRPTLPRRARWVDGLTCDADSWECVDDTWRSTWSVYYPRISLLLPHCTLSWTAQARS